MKTIIIAQLIFLMSVSLFANDELNLPFSCTLKTSKMGGHYSYIKVEVSKTEHRNKVRFVAQEYVRQNFVVSPVNLPISKKIDQLLTYDSLPLIKDYEIGDILIGGNDSNAELIILSPKAKDPKEVKYVALALRFWDREFFEDFYCL